MIKKIILIILILIAIFFNNIITFTANSINSNLQYKELSIKKPKNIDIDSILYENNFYYKGLIATKSQQKNKDEKIYIFNIDANSSMGVYFNESNTSFNNKNAINISNNFNLFNDINSSSDILKYNNKNIYYTNLKSLKIFTIYKNNIKIDFVFSKYNDINKTNKLLFKFINNIN